MVGKTDIYVQYFVSPVSAEMKDLWKWGKNKIKINIALNNIAVIKIWGVPQNISKKEDQCITSVKNV